MFPTALTTPFLPDRSPLPAFGYFASVAAAYAAVLSIANVGAGAHAAAWLIGTIGFLVARIAPAAARAALAARSRGSTPMPKSARPRPREAWPLTQTASSHFGRPVVV